MSHDPLQPGNNYVYLIFPHSPVQSHSVWQANN